jgi:HEAT repeat protein
LETGFLEAVFFLPLLASIYQTDFMKTIGRICLIFFLLSCCGKCWAEPGYQGKTLSAWLDDYGAGPKGYKPYPQADEALRQIGSDAVPYLLELLRKTNTPAVDEELRQIGVGTLNGTNTSNFIPASWFHWKAYLGFQALGPEGKSAIPDLARLAHADPDGNSFYPSIGGMKHIDWVANLANNSSSYVTLGDGAAFDDGKTIRNTNRFFGGDFLMRNTKPFLVDGEIAAWSLAAIGADAVPSLMELLDNPSPHLKQRAAEALGLAGSAAEPAVPTLVKLLEDSDFTVRQRVADALGEIGKRPDLAVPALISIINDPGYGVGSIAAEALGKFGERATNAIPALLEGMKSGPYLVKSAAAIALSKISRETVRKEVIPVLISDLKRPGSHNTALITLSQMQDETDLVIPAIIGALDDSDEMVQHNAMNMLGRFGFQAKAAAPKLISLATNQSIHADSAYNLHEDATNALDKIEPAWRTSH